MLWLKRIFFIVFPALLVVGVSSTLVYPQGAATLVQIILGSSPVSNTNPLPVTGTFSATLAGFTPNGSFASLTATGASASVALPTGTVVAVQNTGSTTVSCTFGVGSATATANEIQVPASSTVFATVGSNTFGACIDQTGSASNVVVFAGGSGLGTGFGGGGGGGSAPANSTATGSITTTQSVTLTPNAGQSSVGIQVSGTWTGTLFVEGSVDGTNFIQTTVVPVLSGSVQTATITASGMYQANLAGFASFRIRGNTVASGTAVVTLIGTSGTATVMADNPFPVTGYTGMTPLNAQGTIATGSATSAFPLMIGGTATGASGGNAQVAKVDSNGSQFVDVNTASNNLYTALTNPPSLSVNAANHAWTGLTPGTAQTGTIYAANTDLSSIGGSAVVPDPCMTAVPTYLAISQATSTQIITGTASKKTYICSIFVMGADAENISLVEGTGTVCATSTAAIVGGTTAANGMNFTAGSGWAQGNGRGAIAAASAVAADNVCLLQSGTGRVAGNIKYVQQ